MKKKTFLALTVILLACSFAAGSALAQEGKKFYVGGSGLYVFKNLDTDHTKAKFSGPVNIDFDNSWGVQGRMGYVVNKYLSVEALVEYVAPFKAETGANKAELDVFDLTLNAKATLPVHEKFIPYAVLGLGVMNAYEKIQFGGAESKTNNWGASFRGGLGADYYITPEVSLNIEGAYNRGMGDVDHVRYITVGFGAAYHF
jgi:opacity protein-like surface antigen